MANPTNLRKRSQVIITGIGAVIAAMITVMLFNPEDQFVYTTTRLGLSLIGFVSCTAILFQSIDRVRRISNSPEQRLRMVTIVLLLTEISALLALGVLITWDDPPPTNPFSAAIGVMIRASLAYGTAILAATRPEDDSDSTTINRTEYVEFLNWKKKSNGSD